MCQPPPAADTPPRAKPDAMAPAELASEPVKHSIDLSITRQARVFFQHRPSECNFRGTTYHSVHCCAPTLLRSPKLLRPSTRRDRAEARAGLDARRRRRHGHRIAACLGLVPRIVCVCTRASCGLGVDAVDMRAWCRTVYIYIGLGRIS